MSTAILSAEIQVRVDAISYTTGTEQAAEVLQLATDAVGAELAIDLTNLLSVQNSISSAIVTGVTSDDDLTAISLASLLLGITSKSGGGLPAVYIHKQDFVSGLSFPQPDTGEVPSGTPLITLVDIAEKGRISTFTFRSIFTTVNTFLVKITLNGVVEFNENVSITSGNIPRSIDFLGNYGMSTSSSFSYMAPLRSFESFKVEVQSVSMTSAIPFFTDARAGV